MPTLPVKSDLLIGTTASNFSSAIGNLYDCTEDSILSGIRQTILSCPLDASGKPNLMTTVTENTCILTDGSYNSLINAITSGNTAGTTISGVTATLSTTGTGEVANLFDRQTANFVSFLAGQYVLVAFSAAVVLNTFYGEKTFGTDGSVVLEGSNDGGTTWTTLFTTGTSWGWANDGSTKVNNFSNTTAYLLYRLRITSTAGDTIPMKINALGFGVTVKRVNMQIKAPIKATLANGFSGDYASNLLTTLITDTKAYYCLTGTGSGAFCLYLQREANGQASVGYIDGFASDVALHGPIAPSSPVVNAHWFNTNDMKMRRWDGSTWVELSLPRIFIAEVRYANQAITAIVYAALKGIFDTGPIAVTAGNEYTVYHGMFTDLVEVVKMERQNVAKMWSVNSRAFNAAYFGATVSLDHTAAVLDYNTATTEYIGGVDTHGSSSFAASSSTGQARLIVKRLW